MDNRFYYARRGAGRFRRVNMKQLVNPHMLFRPTVLSFTGLEKGTLNMKQDGQAKAGGPSVNDIFQFRATRNCSTPCPERRKSSKDNTTAQAFPVKRHIDDTSILWTPSGERYVLERVSKRCRSSSEASAFWPKNRLEACKCCAGTLHEKDSWRLCKRGRPSSWKRRKFHKQQQNTLSSSGGSAQAQINLSCSPNMTGSSEVQQTATTTAGLVNEHLLNDGTEKARKQQQQREQQQDRRKEKKNTRYNRRRTPDLSSQQKRQPSQTAKQQSCGSQPDSSCSISSVWQSEIPRRAIFYNLGR